MKLKTFCLKILLILCFGVYKLSAQNLDFILNETCLSYHLSLADGPGKLYLNQYLAQSSKNITNLFKIWPNSNAIMGLNLPLLGKPFIQSAAGLNLGISDDPETDWNDIGMRIIDPGAGGMVDINLFTTFSLDKIFKQSNLGILKKTDITLNFIHFHMTGWDDVRLNIFNIGAALRKQIVSEISLLGKYAGISGVTLSLGILFSGVAGREDDIGNGFYSDVENSENESEIVVVDEGTQGTVIVSAPVTDYIESYVHYPYVEFNYLAVHSGIKGYVNLAYFLDVFSGINFAVIPYNEFYVDVSSDVNVRLMDKQGLDTNYDGKITIIGSTTGSFFLPMISFGFQLNFGPVKIPFQISQSMSAEIRAVNAGIYITF